MASIWRLHSPERESDAFFCDAGVTNSVPENAHVCWDLRCEENDGMATLKERVVRAIESSAAAYGASADIRIVKEMPAAIIDEDATAIVSRRFAKPLARLA